MTASAEPRCPIAFDPLRWGLMHNRYGWTLSCLACWRAWFVGTSERTPEIRATQRLMDAHAATCQEKGS